MSNLCSSVHIHAWWRSNAVCCQIYTINCVWNVCDALFTQTSPLIRTHGHISRCVLNISSCAGGYLLSIGCFFSLFCSHLFVSLTSFYSDFPQLTFQSILLLFTDLILCGVCKLAFGLCPLSQQIFVYGLFCSYLTADHQWLCLCCTGIVCVCMCMYQ